MAEVAGSYSGSQVPPKVGHSVSLIGEGLQEIADRLEERGHWCRNQISQPSTHTTSPGEASH